MSSLRNAVKRIAHKERSQPVDRQHLGILEKKKDYKQRAVDYHRKEDRIKAMKQKASMRNPDEFYFGMHNSRVEAGKHRSNEDNRELAPDLVKMMKDQDLSYVRMQRQTDTKKAEKLQASLHMLDSDNLGSTTKTKTTSKRMHTVFVESAREAREFDPAEHFDTIPEFSGRAFNRLRKSDIEQLAKQKMGDLGGGDDANETKPKPKLTARSSAYREMESRRERAETMQTAEDHLVTEKLVASKGRKRKIKSGEDGKPAQYKWRRKRLR
eukprot:jgi/Psemu1/197796/e_gw1.210.104.1